MGSLVVYGENRLCESFELKPNGLVVNGSPSLTEWLHVGDALKQAHGATQWWIGDWLNYGEAAYGETYAQALDETEYDYETLRNFKYVAGRCELSRRRDNLPWSHHQEVAPLEPEQQKEWLEKAARGDGNGKIWSRATLRTAIRDSKNDTKPSWLKHTDVWTIASCDGRFGTDYPGRIPGQVVLNVLHYFTEEGALIVDPMAGGGVTIDACTELNRQCVAYDVMPSRAEIIQHDATEPWPLEQWAELVFIDPPYWSQMASDYGGMATKPYDEYLSDMAHIFNNAYNVLQSGGILAVLIAPVAIQHEYTDIPFDFVRACQELGYKLIRRISVPVSSQQVGPRVMEHCRENGILVALLRDLLVFEK